ncbi:MAG: hypothetical protein EXQ56_10195 [Acidobacteria bacterium]|nr:hypothetical protein [Acidobacteriota bacterium]
MMLKKNGWLRRGLLTAMAVGVLTLTTMAPVGLAQNGNGRGPFDTPPGKSDDGPGNSGGNGNGNGNENSNKNANGKKSGRDSLSVVAKNATGSAGTITPMLPDDEAANWRYVACLPNATSINETFPIEFKLTNENDHAGDSVDVDLDASGRLADKVAVPSVFPIQDNGNVALKNIVVTANDLADGAYTLNVHVRATPQRSVEVSQRMIHIHLLVGKACSGDTEESTESRPPAPSQPPSNPQPPAGGALVNTVPAAAGTGFFTDGDFNLLENCSGADVSANMGGTFAIVARAQSSVISSTNPGTFYLNWIWDNTGGEKNVSIELSAVNLMARGANAVHAAQFDANGFVKNEDNFDLVNEDGKPCGPDGPCMVKVAAGKKLWVNWHLTFAGKGQSAATISKTCGEGLPISATATLKEGANTLSTTTVNAKGFVK